VLTRPLRHALLPCILLIAVAGCCCSRPERLRPPTIAKPAVANYFGDWWGLSDNSCQGQIDAFNALVDSLSLASSTFPTASRIGEDAYALAERLHAESDERAIDYWARAIAWMDQASAHHHGCHANPECVAGDCSKQSFGCRFKSSACRARFVRQSAETRILTTGQSYGRLSPSSHLFINGYDQVYHIPVTHQGFAWQSEDFDRLLVYEPTDAPGNVCGRGVPLIVLTRGQTANGSTSSLCSKLTVPSKPAIACNLCNEESFVFPGTPFAATAVITIPPTIFMNSGQVAHAFDQSMQSASVVFYNPLTLERQDGSARIAESPGMPLGYVQQISQYNPVRVFLNSDSDVSEARLRFFEPYQCDKIPLVFVHGLLSDPTTFIELADAVRADPELRARYQIWAFRYPTGEPFLKSAASLRRQLALAFAQSHAFGGGCISSAEAGSDSRAVIVGHSMGGLVAKMQITDSGDRLWRAVSNVPLEQLRAPSELITNISESFFFQASPQIGRVVYIATPHGGSPWASRGIGRLGGALARRPLNEEAAFNELMRANPNALAGEFGDSFPSSVDLLRPRSTLLQALASLESSPAVAVHSIVGDHCRLLLAGRSDGVVPIESALVREAESTLVVNESHTSIQQSRETQAELRKILKLHLSEPSPSVRIQNHPLSSSSHSSQQTLGIHQTL
jgi:triacylglycerol esterase/lipase EstA (alpha/beta hydrolase family)